MAKQRKPKGQPIPRTDEQLEQLSEIKPDDTEAARAAVSGTIVGRLLDAVMVEDQEKNVGN